MNKNTSLKNIIILLALIVIFLFGSYYFIYNDIRNRNQQLFVTEGRLSLDNNKQNYLISTGRIIQSIDADIKNIDNSIIAKDGDVEFIENLDSLAKNDAVVLKIEALTFEDDTTVASSTIKNFKIRANAQGTWYGVYKFISKIEALPTRTKISRLVLINSSDQGNFDTKKSVSSNWQASFEMTVLKYQ